MTRQAIRAGVAVLGSAGLLAFAGCGGASSGSGSGSPAASSQRTPAGTSASGGQSAQQPQGRAGGPFSQTNLSALAKELGVSTTRLQQALAAARPGGARPGAPPSGAQGSGRPPAGAGGGGSQLAAGLAEQLNLPTNKVQQALAKFMPGRPQSPSAGPAQN